MKIKQVSIYQVNLMSKIYIFGWLLASRNQQKTDKGREIQGHTSLLPDGAEQRAQEDQ